MNNLHRELAPISDAAWADIEEETTRTLKRGLGQGQQGQGEMHQLSRAGELSALPPKR